MNSRSFKSEYKSLSSTAIKKEAIKRFFVLTAILTMINITALWSALSLLNHNEANKYEVHTQASIQLATELITKKLDTATSDLSFLASHSLLNNDNYESKAWLSDVIRLFTKFSSTHDMYYQIRLIDLDGKERVRVEREGERIIFTVPEELQDKSQRYYFTQSKSMSLGQIYVSRFDLNIENGEVETPFNPTIRLASPLFNGIGEFWGSIIINYDGKTILETINNQNPGLMGQALLINEKGDYLISPEKEKEWAFMFNKKVSFIEDEPLIWKKISQTPKGTLIEGNRQLVYGSVEPFKNHTKSKLISDIRHWKIIFFNDSYGSFIKIGELSFLFPLWFIYPIGLVIIWFWAKESALRKVTSANIEKLNKKLELEVRNQTLELQATKNATVFSLGALTEARDHETGQHIIRTQQYINILAMDLLANEDFKEELTKESIDHIVNAAPLHDIGKVAIPDHILLKPGKLTEEEQKIMQSHTVLGANALDEALAKLQSQIHINTKSTFLHFARDIVRHHHEKWDGSGYPDGLMGEQIPLSARLMALADAYDALASPRVYKKAFSKEKIERIICDKNAGHFDPVILGSFERVKELFWSIKQGNENNVGST